MIALMDEEQGRTPKLEEFAIDAPPPLHFWRGFAERLARWNRAARRSAVLRSRLGERSYVTNRILRRIALRSKEAVEAFEHLDAFCWDHGIDMWSADGHCARHRVYAHMLGIRPGVKIAALYARQVENRNWRNATC